ncbi:hypothetical protein [Hungatella hathewayi]|uniref:hypothetical protein n=1 Tax=Hungatella hathewayi TaxID=154046 RepID=UPI002671BC9C|nr:hypothetical protein [Hungatella hathewayi]
MDKRRIVEIFYEITNMEEEEFEKLRTTILLLRMERKNKNYLQTFSNILIKNENEAIKAPFLC